MSDMEEVAIELAKFAKLFNRNYQAAHRSAKQGKLKGAVFIGSRWYVLIPKRALMARQRAVFGQSSDRNISVY